MIIDFSIQNFGSVKDEQKLSFEADANGPLEDYYIINAGKFRLLKLALIYGANASGKTTILNALHFLRMLVTKPQEKKTDTLKFEPYLFDPDTPQQNTILAINFIEKQVHYSYRVEFNKRCIVKEELDFYNTKKANVFIRTTDVDKQLSTITFGGKIKADKTAEKTLVANTLWNNTVLGGFLKTNIDLKELKDATDWFSKYMKRPIKPNSDLSSYAISSLQLKFKKDAIVNILKKADFNISDIRIDEKDVVITDETIKLLEEQHAPTELITRLKSEGKISRPDLLFQHTLNNKTYDLPFKSESQGTQRYFGLAVILGLLIKEAAVIPIDELESSLHPELYVQFLLSFLTNAKNSQLIATTHYRELLDNKDIFRNDAIWFTDKSATGATELYSLADFDSSVIRDTSSVYNAYKIGKLGGVPDIGDYYIDLEK